MIEQTTRITTLEEHRKLLKSVFDTAKRRVLIVSPFITDSAVKQDRVPEMIKKANKRGVGVEIYTDDDLNCSIEGLFNPRASKGIASLVSSGARVTIVHGIHNKTLARDNDLITEGSFNWLSAVRTNGATHQREERTMVVEGEQAKSMIEDEIKKLEEVGKPISLKPNNTKKTSRSLRIITFIAAVYCGGLLMGFGPFSANMFGWLVICSVFVIVLLLLRRGLGFKSSNSTPSNDINFDSIENASTTSMTTKTSLGGDY